MSLYELMLHLKIKVSHCDLYFMVWVSDFAIYLEGYLMYKHDTLE